MANSEHLLILQRGVAHWNEWRRQHIHIRVDLIRANLQGLNLKWIDLRDADLVGANLRHANLMGADLRWANLGTANLEQADLRSADLRFANLTDALLVRSNLQAADLRSSVLTNANLTDSNLIEVSWSATKLREPVMSEARATAHGSRSRHVKAATLPEFIGSSLTDRPLQLEAPLPLQSLPSPEPNSEEIPFNLEEGGDFNFQVNPQADPPPEESFSEQYSLDGETLEDWIQEGFGA